MSGRVGRKRVYSGNHCDIAIYRCDLRCSLQRRSFVTLYVETIYKHRPPYYESVSGNRRKRLYPLQLERYAESAARQNAAKRGKTGHLGKPRTSSGSSVLESSIRPGSSKESEGSSRRTMPSRTRHPVDEEGEQVGCADGAVAVEVRRWALGRVAARAERNTRRHFRHELTRVPATRPSRWPGRAKAPTRSPRPVCSFPAAQRRDRTARR